MNAKKRSLYEHVRDRQVLLRAWRTIRNNAERSGNVETKKKTKAFEDQLFSNVENIQRRLRKGTYKFAEAFGVAVKKGKNKPGKRAIVIASVQDRVVQRAILDVLYSNCTSPEVIEVLKTETSVGGVPGRGIGHALALIEQAVERGATYVIKSDIHDFFPSLPRKRVTEFFAQHIDDKAFVDLFEHAVTVELSNRASLGTDAELFPLGEDGVAQGSPLSVLAGNVVLREFDRKLNGRGVRCVRYIDDFAILAPSKSSAQKALSSGLKILNELKLQAYSPGDGSGKSSAGPTSVAYDFLGYKIVQGLNPPSEGSSRKLLEKIDAEIVEGRKWVNRTIELDVAEVKVRQCYVQTLIQIDSILRGWAGAFQFSQSIQSFQALDRKIDRKLAEFNNWFGAALRSQPIHILRRATGIRLLSDTTPRDLPDLICK